MTIHNLSNTNAEELVQAACNVFAEKDMLQFHVNRKATHITLPKLPKGAVLNLDRHLRNALLERAAKKVDDAASFFFYDLDGNTYCIDQEILDRFTDQTRERCPDLKFKCQVAIVDKETDTELMPADTAQAYSQVNNDGCPFDFRASLWVAQRIPVATIEGKR
ncbi:MAG: hypothetical protein WAM28_01620 [Chlamydiales bacterium]